ncbi:hypothetical protein ES332_A03G124500v1 [Gossypium tomentosum]|uniref:CLAVATA3/ESR-like protein n=1 Tax=Gossypium tomentosum TaxID=34277 RepID=A0A5D2R7A2_GOSTO|nr:hypothetical protein ES332_A03G124500v1 [Gossypium tomentosum]
MVCSSQRVLLFLIFIGLLAIQADKVCGLRGIHFVLKQTRKAVEMKEMRTEQKPLPVNNKTDPNESSKRRVRRGSDPIHNRS